MFAKSLMTLISTTLVFAALVACETRQSSETRTEAERRSDVLDGAAPILNDENGEVSLRADRSELDSFRKDIPEEVRKQNDEISMLLSYVVRDSEEDPSRLRDRFNTALRKKREAVDKQIRRAREDFSKRERAERETFLRQSKQSREDYLSSRKRSSDDRKHFFEDQTDKRKAFFADQQEKRKDFEMRIQDERKGVEDGVREKRNAFNQEWRAYQARYTERKKQTELKKKMERKARDMERAGKPVLPVTAEPAVAAPTTAMPSQVSPQDPLAEFDHIPAGPATPLLPGKSGP